MATVSALSPLRLMIGTATIAASPSPRTCASN
jgi:hypothetical protein